MDEEFDKLLLALGWRRADLARRLGLSRESVSRWPRPPKYAMAYLRAMLQIKRIRDELHRSLQA